MLNFTQHQDGQKDFQEILTNIQKNANSDAEPGCLEYRPARTCFVEEGSKDLALSVHRGQNPTDTPMRFKLGP